jgi:hypothetical protein
MCGCNEAAYLTSRYRWPACSSSYATRTGTERGGTSTPEPPERGAWTAHLTPETRSDVLLAAATTERGGGAAPRAAPPPAACRRSRGLRVEASFSREGKAASERRAAAKACRGVEVARCTCWWRGTGRGGGGRSPSPLLSCSSFLLCLPCRAVPF